MTGVLRDQRALYEKIVVGLQGINPNNVRSECWEPATLIGNVVNQFSHKNPFLKGSCTTFTL